jgi:hypothetical protein
LLSRRSALVSGYRLTTSRACSSLSIKTHRLPSTRNVERS